MLKTFTAEVLPTFQQQVYVFRLPERKVKERNDWLINVHTAVFQLNVVSFYESIIAQILISQFFIFKLSNAALLSQDTKWRQKRSIVENSLCLDNNLERPISKYSFFTACVERES
jgi:hypothetical protein